MLVVKLVGPNIQVKTNMERARKTTVTTKTETSPLKVVVVKNDQVQIEQEIERNIKKIKSLIQKLRPPERQRYFLGLLSHIVSEPTQINIPMNSSKLNFDIHPTRLSTEEAKLLEELSMKMEQLYRSLDHDPS